MTVKELKAILDKLDPDKKIIVDYQGNSIELVLDTTEYTPGLPDFKGYDDAFKNEYVFMITEMSDIVLD